MTNHEPGDTPLSELLELARITPGDIDHGKAAWKRDARPGVKELLDARASEIHPRVSRAGKRR